MLVEPDPKEAKRCRCWNKAGLIADAPEHRDTLKKMIYFFLGGKGKKNHRNVCGILPLKKSGRGEKRKKKEGRENVAVTDQDSVRKLLITAVIATRLKSNKRTR